MPVVTRSCGRKGPRSRIEDPTPRKQRKPCQTTVKRKKEAFDEEMDKPARKKPNTSVRIQKTANTPTTGNTKQSQPSKIPRRITTGKSSVKIELTKDDENSNSDEENIVQSTPHETSTYNVTPPVAARTRNYNSLKRSYQRKKNQKNLNKDNNQSLDSSLSESHSGTSRDDDNTTTPEPKEKQLSQLGKPSQVGDIDSSTCESNDIEMRDAQGDIRGDEKHEEHFYKAKFHELLEHVKSMQASFNLAQTNASKNIKAYDAFIKELKESLEKERTKTVTIEEQLQKTKDQLIESQKELEQAHAQPKGSSSETSSGDLQKIDNSSSLESMIKFYEMLSGISLSHDGDFVDSFERYRCVFKPKGSTGKALQFHLTYDKEFEQVEFIPIAQSPTSGEFLQQMPKYLRENIYFDTDQVPCFLSRLIQPYPKLR